MQTIKSMTDKELIERRRSVFDELRLLNQEINIRRNNDYMRRQAEFDKRFKTANVDILNCSTDLLDPYLDTRSSRVLYALRQNGEIRTIRDLLFLTPIRLKSRYHNCGIKTANNICAALAAFDLTLAP